VETAKSPIVILLLVDLVALACGCGPAAVGPAVFEMRVRSVPSRESSCALEWLSQIPEDAPAPIGTLTMTRGVPVDDPLGASVRAVVGPRACAMGGSRVALANLSIADTRPVAATYVVYPRAQTRSP
jgi:hypothetical protein